MDRHIPGMKQYHTILTLRYRPSGWLRGRRTRRRRGQRAANRKNKTDATEYQFHGRILFVPFHLAQAPATVYEYPGVWAISRAFQPDRKRTRLNSSHTANSYA